MKHLAWEKSYTFFSIACSSRKLWIVYWTVCLFFIIAHCHMHFLKCPLSLKYLNLFQVITGQIRCIHL